MVCRNPNIELYEQPEEPHRSDSTTTNGLKNRAENIVDSDEMNERIQKILRLLTPRDQSYLIQFWSPSSVGKYNLLKTVDQPFGIGIHNQGLCNYRSESECSWFLVDKECKEEDLIPIVRVFRRQLPEWTSDVTNYHSKKHPLQDCVILWNLHGYLVLPVFDSITMLCVGVLELLTSSKYLDCAYEVQEVHRTLKEANLTSPQAYDSPISYVDYKNRQHELDEIFKGLKDVCDTHKLPLAQTWVVSSKSSFVATEIDIEITCDSFNVRCIGKVCMSTTGLPFYVQDLRFWHFREACRKHHLLKSEGVVGRALSSHGSCFCPDVTKLLEDEYSLVHNARMSGLTGCFAIYLHSNEHDDGYLLEFFLPDNLKEDSELHNLVQMMKMHFKFSSIEFGDINVIGIPMEASQSSLTMQLTDTSQRSSSKETMQLDSKDPHIVGETNAQIDYINAQDQCDSGQASHKNGNTAITNTEEMYVDDVITTKSIDVAIKGKECISGEKLAFMKQKRKHRTDTLTSKHVQNNFDISIGVASRSLGSLSRKILQQDSGDIQTTWETNYQDQHDFSNGYPKNWSNAMTNTEVMLVDDADSKKLGVSQSTLKRVCRELKIASWPMPHRSKKYAHFGISAVVLLIVRIKRWICSSNHLGFYAMWWICGKHNAFVCELNTSTIISPKGKTNCWPLNLSQLTKESDESFETTTPFSKPPQAHFDVYQASLKKKRVVNVSDTRTVTVKATFKDDIIKFQLPLSAGMSELKNQVAERVKLKSTRLCLKYMDEDDDLILISSDADFRNLMPFSASSVSKNTIKLIVQMADN